MMCFGGVRVGSSNGKIDDPNSSGRRGAVVV